MVNPLRRILSPLLGPRTPKRPSSQNGGFISAVQSAVKRVMGFKFSSLKPTRRVSAEYIEMDDLHAAKEQQPIMPKMSWVRSVVQRVRVWFTERKLETRWVEMKRKVSEVFSRVVQSLSRPKKEVEIRRRGESFSVDFDCDGEVVGREHVKWIDTVDETRKFFEKQKVVCQQDPEQSARCDQVIANCDERAKHMSWNPSPHFRELLKAGEGIHNSDVEEAAQAFEKVVDKHVPAPVNMTIHKFEDENGKRQGIPRLGVICDLKNGFTHLGEMKRMVENEDLRDQLKQKLEWTIDANTTEACEGRKDISSKKKHKMQAAAASAQYALNQIKDEDSLQRAIARRTIDLQNQTMILLAEQVELHDPEEMGDTFCMLNLGLINQKKKTIDKTGWVQNEGNEMFDMQAAFAEVDGKDMIFDGKGPYIDEKGVHMAKEVLVGDGDKPKTVQLKAVQVNTCVQESRKGSLFQQKSANVGRQKVLNDEGFKKLTEFFGGKSKLPEDLQEIEDRLQAGESNYVLARDFVQACLNNKIAVSVGCQSSKDRTGSVVGSVACEQTRKNIDKHFQKEIDAVQNEIETLKKQYNADKSQVRFKVYAQQAEERLEKIIQKRDQYKKKAGDAIYAPNGAAAQIVWNNTQVTQLKVGTFEMLGMYEGELNIFQKIDRIWFAAKQFWALKDQLL